ncbi:SET domain-containing protein [Novipirellula caenicola]|uniref:SET domain protein n=1 Tax=Novipirellula caenicola TaxID=1536901 RepID=A0ABP9VXJ1_9BACT
MKKKSAKKRREKLQKKVDELHGYRCYHDDDVEVRKGKYGLGVYAVRQFLPGELVFEVTGQLLSHENYHGSNYVMELNENWYLEPTIPAAFLNHSCSPNSELVQLTKYSLGLVAICNIEPESEIVFDYQWEPHEGTPQCRCGALNCRGWVVAAHAVHKMGKPNKKEKKK